MKHIFDLSLLDWTVEGYTPHLWLFERLYGGMGDGSISIDVPPVPARVPGSVQDALRRAGILPDWNIGMNYRACEWVENRQWLFRAHIPVEWIEANASFRLECLGLDYSGWVYVNRREAGTFRGTHLPHSFDITPLLNPLENVLEIIFDLPPRWLGQFGYTSQMKEWKTRFNYTWDWSPRLLQIAIWDSLSLAAVSGSEIKQARCFTDVDLQTARGVLEFGGEISLSGAQSLLDGTEWVDVCLEREKKIIRSEKFPLRAFEQGVRWENLPVELWWPNLEGDQPLYWLTCRLLDGQGQEQDRFSRRLGFKHVEWVACEGAPSEADPWVCVVNGRPVFLQGVNIAPLCANYADLTQEDYARRLKIYQELGLNLFRINACQFLERQWFYDLCDEMGLMVWQEFPLTASGLENWPPEDEASIDGLAAIAASFIQRRRHHVSLLLWSGGNELQGNLNGQKSGTGLPCTLEHPMLKRLQEVTHTLDPYHRFIHTSPSGPRAGANPADFGKGLHWDVHSGAAMMTDLEQAKAYWAADDALFRSETYCPGASPAEMIRRYAGEFETFPASTDNPYWTRLTTWWNDWKKMITLHGREPVNLEEYVAWSQEYQATMIAHEMKACKDRFPRCGGILHWSGHDTFPLTINTSLITFDGELKLAAQAVSKVWHGLPGEVSSR